MFGWLMKLLRRVRCRVCNKWTEPSILEGFYNVCSIECVVKEKKDYNVYRERQL